MKLLVLCEGRLKEPWFKDAQQEYLGRLRRYATVEVRDMKDGAAMVRAVPEGAKLVLLDERGESWSSPEWAKKLLGAAEARGGHLPLCFVLGGADGVPAALRPRALHTLSFGRATLPHRLARIVLLEQIYRGFTILRGEPYHHE